MGREHLKRGIAVLLTCVSSHYCLSVCLSVTFECFIISKLSNRCNNTRHLGTTSGVYHKIWIVLHEMFVQWTPIYTQLYQFKWATVAQSV